MSDFKSRIALFQNRAIGNTNSSTQNPTSYNHPPMKKLNIDNILQKAQEDQRQIKQKGLKKTKTESLFHVKYNGGNVQRFKENWNIKKKKRTKKRNKFRKK